MTLPQTTVARGGSLRDLARALVVAAAIVVVTIALDVVLGVHQSGPSYDLVPDPASLSGLPF
jgi:hypothetical protein